MSFQVGNNPPHECWAVVEIEAKSGPAKYEFDEKFSRLVVDRFMPTSMSYPYHYGFIPHTLGGDGDPLDVMIYTEHSLLPGSMISVRPIGALHTIDEKGEDKKILALPALSVDSSYSHITSCDHIPDAHLKRIEHFFENYKKLESGRWIKVSHWDDCISTHKIILKAIADYEAHNNHGI